MKALFESFRRFDARRIFGFIRRLGGMSRPKVKCYDLRSTRALRVEGDGAEIGRRVFIGISIHALRVEGDEARVLAWIAGEISIHALRVEGDRSVALSDYLLTISIHALRVEGDSLQNAGRSRPNHNFYPRPPGGGRRGPRAGVDRRRDFYPRPPGGGRQM